MKLSTIQRDRDTGYHRVEAFSDAVMAIILTLTAYDLLRLGEVPAGQLLERILSAWPSYVAFLVSFLVVGQVWIVHHNLWRFIKVVDQATLLLNLALLLSIAILPFAAKLIATRLDGPTDELTLAAGLYAAIALTQAILFNVALRWAWHRGLFDEDMDRQRYSELRRRFLIGPAVYLVALLIDLWSPFVSVASYTLVPVTYLSLGFAYPQSAAED